LKRYRELGEKGLEDNTGKHGIKKGRPKKGLRLIPDPKIHSKEEIIEIYERQIQLLKKSWATPKTKKYQMIYEMSETYNLNDLCTLFGVAKRNVMNFINGKTYGFKIFQSEELVNAVLKEYAVSKHTYGMLKMYYALKNRFDTSYSQIRSIMNKFFLKSIVRPKRHSGKYNKSPMGGEDFVKRNFNCEQPNKLLFLDGTLLSNRENGV
jgi:hypothetical protein